MKRKPYNTPRDRVVPKRKRDALEKRYGGNHEIESSRQKVLGHYVNCRHYSAAEESDGTVSVACEKNGRQDDCGACYICPKCGGKLFLDSHTTFQGFKRYRAEDKVCLQCGARYPSRMVLVKQKPSGRGKDKPQFPDFCAVEGCRKRTWEGHIFTEGDREFIICDYHHSLVRGKAERRPLVVVLGKLIHDPASDYRRRKGIDMTEEKTCCRCGKTSRDDKAPCGKCGCREGGKTRVVPGSVPFGKPE